MPIKRKRKSKSILSLVKEYAGDKINEAYLENIVHDKRNRYFVHSMNETITDGEITTIICYRITSKTAHKTRYARIIFLVHPRLRSMGYGSVAMNEFIDFIRDNNRRIELILHSVEPSIPFYRNLDFTEILPTRFIKSYEDLDEYTGGCFMKVIH